MTTANRNNWAAWAPFAYGFRPFFLLAGLYAVASITAWLWMYGSGHEPTPGMSPQHWHGHEMIFGFIGAAIGGFLLTAVPSWTGSRGFAGPPLVALVLLWLAGRIVFALGPGIPDWVLAVGELVFVPGLLLAIAPSLLRAANRNWPLTVLLAIFWAADAVFVFAVMHDNLSLASDALLAAMNVVLMLITVIGGRIIPVFTGNALRASGSPYSLRFTPLVERLVLPTMLAILLCDVVLPGHPVTAIVVALATVLHVWRLSGWHGWRMARQPIVWVLHIAYLWLPVGLALKLAWLVGGFGWAAHWQHALGTGAAGMMILAVMTRAALGHTGRPLEVHALIAVAYGLLAIAVVVRVLGLTLLPLNYPFVVFVAGLLWIVAFIPYLVIYAPILLRPRADGRPG